MSEKSQETVEKKPREDGKKSLINTILFVGLVVLFSFLFVTFIGQRTTVSGSSMETTLSDGDNLMVDKLTYRFGDPKRFDIVIFPPRFEEDTLYIKRVIGLPGETVQIDYDGNIYINGSILEEDYGREVIRNPGIAVEPITLGRDEFFVMGDNRNNSSDSRVAQIGPIKKSEIIGRAFIRIYPFDKFGILKHG